MKLEKPKIIIQNDDDWDINKIVKKTRKKYEEQ